MPLVGKQIDGIWHTGVIVYGHEFFFSGGIQEMPHEHFVHNWGNNLPPERIIDLGVTQVDEAAFKEFLNSNSHRFTASTYNLLTWNCNNFSDEVSKFLLGHGIPDYITSLPQEVLNSPIGHMLRPMLDQMSARGAQGNDPFAAAHSAPPSQPAVVAATSSEPVLVKLDKYLLSTDASAAAGLAVRLQGYLKSDDDKNSLAALATVLQADSSIPIPAGSLKPLQYFVENQVADFAALCLSRLAVLHVTDTHKDAAADLLSCILARLGSSKNGLQSDPALAMALCVLANSFSSKAAQSAISREPNFSRCVDAGLANLQKDSKEVKQFSAALVANCALKLLNDGVGGHDAMPDEAVHILMGALEGIEKERDGEVGVRRLLAVKRILDSSPLAHALALECGLNHVIQNYLEQVPQQSNPGRAAKEVLNSLNQDVSHCDT